MTPPPLRARAPWAALVIGAFVAGARLAVGFVGWETRRPAPLIDVSLFRRAPLAIAPLLRARSAVASAAAR